MKDSLRRFLSSVETDISPATAQQLRAHSCVVPGISGADQVMQLQRFFSKHQKTFFFIVLLLNKTYVLTSCSVTFQIRQLAPKRCVVLTALPCAGGPQQHVLLQKFGTFLRELPNVATAVVVAGTLNAISLTGTMTV